MWRLCLAVTTGEWPVAYALLSVWVCMLDAHVAQQWCSAHVVVCAFARADAM